MQQSKIEKQKNILIQVLYWGMIVGALLMVWKVLFPVLMPFIIGFVVAAILNKPVTWMTKKLKINHKFTASVCVLVLMFLLGSLIFFGVSSAISGLQSFVSFLPTLFHDFVIPSLEEVLIRLNELFESNHIPWIEIITTNSQIIIDSINKTVNSISNGILSSLATMITWVPNIFMQTVITIIATFFISMDYQKIQRFIQAQIPESKKGWIDRVKLYVGHVIPKFIVSYGLILCITFVELLIGFTILDVPYKATLAALIAVLDILPILGTGGVLIPWSIFSLINQNFTIGIGLLILYVVITIIRNIVEPRLIGKQMGLHPVLTLASMLVGLRLFGFLGLFLLPLTLSFVKKLNDDGVIHLFKPVPIIEE